MTTLLSLADAAIDDEVGIMTILSFLCVTVDILGSARVPWFNDDMALLH